MKKKTAQMVSNQKNIFFSRKPKKPSFGGPSPIVLEKMVFLFFLVFWIFLVCWFLLVSCFVVFCLDLARTRLPSAVGPLGGGGVSIYIYIWRAKWSCVYIHTYIYTYKYYIHICIYIIIYVYFLCGILKGVPSSHRSLQRTQEVKA